MPKYQASEFASGLKYAKILNMAKLCTWQYSQYAELVVFLKILQISHENTLLESLFNKVAGPQRKRL